MSNPEPVDGKCNATTRDGDHCAAYPVHGSDRCRMHGGTNPGATEGNARNLKHGATASPINLQNHLSDDDLAWVEKIVDAYKRDAGWSDDNPRIERLRMYAVMIWQEWSATEVLLIDGQSENATIGVSETGEPIVRTDKHHLSNRQMELSREIRQGLKELGLGKGADDRAAGAQESFVEIVAGLTGSEGGESHT